MDYQASELENELVKKTAEIRLVDQPGCHTVLTLHELFRSKRAAHLPDDVREMWSVLNVLQPQCESVSGVKIVCTDDLDGLWSLCSQRDALEKRGNSPEYIEAQQAVLDAMFGEGRTQAEWNEYSRAEAFERNIAAANVGY